jgi:tRNA (guanine-N7-)-methyltransferase
MSMAVAAVEETPVLEAGSVSLPFGTFEVFGRPCPFELELGAGKGRFLVEWAEARPEIGILGVERTAKYVQDAARRVVRHGLANVRLLHSTAEDVLFRCLAEACLAAVHVYFPDPWPKKRHHKRRLFTPTNVARIAAVLAPGGLLRVKTDHFDYAGEIGLALEAEPRLTRVSLDDTFAGVPPTSFEVKYGVQGRPVQRFAFRRGGCG